MARQNKKYRKGKRKTQRKTRRRMRSKREKNVKRRKSMKKKMRITKRRVAGDNKRPVLPEEARELMQYIIEPVYTPLTDGEINGIVNQYDLRGETREKMIQKLRGLQGKNTIPASYGSDFERRIDAAIRGYVNEVNGISKYVQNEVDEALREGDPFTREEERDLTLSLRGKAIENLRQNLLVAQTYRNDLYNYAVSLVVSETD